MAKSGFWADPKVEPKRAYRWVLNIGGIPQWLCTKVSKPGFSITESEVTYINHKFYYPGRVEWQEVSLTLADPLNPDASATMMSILDASGYKLPKTPDDTSTLSKKKSIDALGTVRISQLDPEGKAAEIWDLVNAWVKDVKFGELDYSSDEMVNIELTLRYDFAEQVLAGPPIALGKPSS